MYNVQLIHAYNPGTVSHSLSLCQTLFAYILLQLNYNSFYRTISFLSLSFFGDLVERTKNAVGSVDLSLRRKKHYYLYVFVCWVIEPYGLHTSIYYYNTNSRCTYSQYNGTRRMSHMALTYV